MGINLPSSGRVFLPDVPQGLQERDRAMYTYLQTMKREVDRLASNMFNNDLAIAEAFNSGVSSTIILTSGSQITIVNGIITNVS